MENNSNTTTLYKIVEDKAMIFSKGNCEELRAKIQELCDCEVTVYKYKQVAANFICTKYNWEEVTQKTLELYLS